MNRTLLLIVISFVTNPAFSQGVKVSESSGNPDASAMLEVESDNKGFLPPRMSTPDRMAISNPAAGLLIFNTELNTIELFDGTQWVQISGITPSCQTAPTAVTASANAVFAGGTLQLTGAASGASSYSWTGPDGFNSSSQNPTIPNTNSAHSGLYTVTATNLCGSTNASVSVTVQTCPTGLSIGSSGYGGKVASTSYPTGSYPCGVMIAATADQSASVQWGCAGTNLNTTSTSVGFGQSNSTSTLNACTTQGIAADICGDLTAGGYDDWFLPSYDEMDILFVNRASIGGFSNVRYWSSSETNFTVNDSRYAWSHDFSYPSGNQQEAPKNTSYAVRCVRAF